MRKDATTMFIEEDAMPLLLWIAALAGLAITAYLFAPPMPVGRPRGSWAPLRLG